MTPPIMQLTEKRKKIADILIACMIPHGQKSAVVETELNISNNVIVENTGNQQKLSSAVLDTMFPRYAAPCELSHYTPMKSLQSIAASNELRLYSVRKRIGQGELDTFAKKHQLNGYLDSSKGEEFYKELSDDLFYTSFAGLTPQDEPQMWNVFANVGQGVRIQFRLTPKHAELRSIQYARPAHTLLNEINEKLVVANEPPFVPWTLSRIGAFYLPSSLAIEDEVRLLLKRHQGGRNDAQNDGTYEYWPIPIGADNDVCRIDAVSITVGPNASQADTEAAVRGTTFESTLIIQS